MSNSNQDVVTPFEFFNAVQGYYGIRFRYDMAADRGNTKCVTYYSRKWDSLKIDWPTSGWCWLNPPFRNLTHWIKKCKEQRDRGCKIITIWPLSGDLNQILTWENAAVGIIHGRIWPEVRGCMLCNWSTEAPRIIRGLTWNKLELKTKW